LSARQPFELMATICPTCQTIECTDPTDFLYSLESNIFPFVINCPPGFSCQGHTYFNIICCGQLLSTTWQAGASVGTITATINALLSQCAVLQQFCGGTTPTLFYNAPQSCTVNCPDGSPYTFTVPAGSFAAADQTTANSQAEQYACQQANLRLMCLPALGGCGCAGGAVNVSLTPTGGIGPFSFAVVSGSLPTGLSLSGTGILSGTTTTPGIFSFSVRVTASDGSTTTKAYSYTVITVTTAMVPGFVVGTPYSFQLQAGGGSGNYAWEVVSGILPSGITMSITGLLSGTPTGLGGGGSVTFGVVDRACENVTRSFFPPKVTVTAQSTTQTGLIIGFPEYQQFQSNPPKKFMRLTWSGFSEQQLWYQGVQIGGARYDYSGTSQIDALGNYISTYSKILSEECTAADNLLTSITTGTFGSQSMNFLGWCGPSGFNFCSPCNLPYLSIGDRAIKTGDAATFDVGNLWGSTVNATTGRGSPNYHVTSNTTLVCNDSGNAGLPSLFQPIPFNQSVPTIGTAFFIGSIIFNHSFSSLLDTEYTETQALSVGQSYAGSGNVAANLRSGYFLTETSVTFALNFSNLLIGNTYNYSYQLWDQTTGQVTPITGTFTALGSTFVVNGTIPVPARGHTTQLRFPTVTFA
jgi:hypothetical protein